MQPCDPTRKDLAAARVEQAAEFLQSAETNMAANDFKTAANRSYYSIFHSMRAVLAFDSFDSKKHSGIISTFNKDYIKTKIFPAEFSKIIKNAFEVRNDSDYDEFYIISKESVAAQIEDAKAFLAAVREYLTPKL